MDELRREYAVFFFTGKKSQEMLNIEKDFSNGKGFIRRDAFFHAFGNHSWWFKKNCFINFLYAKHDFHYSNTKHAFQLYLGIIGIHYTKRKAYENNTVA